MTGDQERIPYGLVVRMVERSGGSRLCHHFTTRAVCITPVLVRTLTRYGPGDKCPTSTVRVAG